jgi:hypothetical protein
MILDRVLDLFRGEAVTIPPFDGALKPNTALDDAPAVRAASAPGMLAVAGGEVLYSSGREVRRLGNGEVVMSFEEDVTALAASPDGRIAVGLAGGSVTVIGGGARTFAFSCPVALAFEDEDTLLICNGSETRRAGEWAADLMEGNRSGAVFRVDLASGQTTALAQGLGFPYGIAPDRLGKRLVIAESWMHRLLAVPLSGGPATPILSDLPGYPARLASAPGDGTLLALFAPRNRLIEFVLKEDAYRADMMREIDPSHWIVPSLSASRSFLEPLQNGAVRSMGIHKPWSPSRSYGLVVELDAAFQPVASYHSRANGTRHGITSAVLHDGGILAASQGGDCIVRIERGKGSP